MNRKAGAQTPAFLFVPNSILLSVYYLYVVNRQQDAVVYIIILRLPDVLFQRLLLAERLIVLSGPIRQ